MTIARRILLVEDDAHIADLLSLHLRDEGLEVVHCARGDDGLAQLERGGWDALVLDLMLPGVDGLEICRRARAMTRYTPIIIISARSSEVHRILGLEIGADDYLAKPFGMMELVSRVNALMRRASAPPVMADDELSCGPIELCVSAHTVQVGGEPITLTLKEFDLLHTLLQNQGHVLSRSQLLEDVWGMTYVGETRTVDVHVQTLRQKLAAAQEGADALVRTVRGVGYCIKPSS